MLLLVCLAGCSSTQRLYEGAARPRDEVAVIRSHTNKSLAVYLQEPSGTVRWPRRGYIELLPGAYSLYAEIRWGRSGGGSLSSLLGNALAASADPQESLTLAFAVEAGRAYDLEIYWIDEQYVYQMTDAETGRLVAGVRVREHFFTTPTIVDERVSR